MNNRLGFLCVIVLLAIPTGCLKKVDELASSGGPRTTLPPDEGGGASSGGSTGGVSATACGEGLPCQGGLCCSGGAVIFQCVNGVYTQKENCGGFGESCDPLLKACTCSPGAQRCVIGQATLIETCVSGFNGVNDFQTGECAFGKVCDPSKNACVTCEDKCVEGDRLCDPLGDVLLECQRIEEFFSCATYVPIFSCDQRNMTCDEDNLGYTPTDLIEYCVNDCGGRGFELEGEECQTVPGRPCAVFICDAYTGELQPDHTSCLAANIECHMDDQCLSCECDEEYGHCVGGTAKHCPQALSCP